MKRSHPSGASPKSFWGFAALLAAAPLGGHVVTRGAGTAALVTILEDKVFITFDLSFAGDWCRAEMVKMDADRDGAVSEPEAEAYMLRTWEEKLAPGLSLSVDGALLPLKRTSLREANLAGEVRAEPAEIYYEVEAPLPPALPASRGDHLLLFTNETLKDESPEPPVWYIPMSRESHADGLAFSIVEPPRLLDMLGPSDVYTMVGRRLEVKFSFRGASAPGPGAGPAGLPPPPVAPRGAPSAEDRFFEDAFKESGSLGSWGKVLLVLLAMAYGAGHALAPGHGKTVVAAYLVGTRGRIRDAVVLGLATTFAHTITVFLAGFGINLALEAGAAAGPAAWQNRIVVVTRVLSGLLLILLGLGLFFRRWRFAGDPEAMAHHSHHGHHHHGHGHGQGTGGQPGLWTLIGLGTSGGLVPCPAGIVLILLGLQYQRLGFSLLLLVFFSLALGAVLVAMGILVVTGARLLPVKVSPRFLSCLPALSALFIAALGTYFTVQGFREGRTEIAALLESLAGAIRS